jgi:integrase/recombinase XerD
MAYPTGLVPARTTIPTDALAAANAYLVRYNGSTRRLYAESLRLFFDWAATMGVDPLHGIRRPHLELYIRHMQEDRGNSPATVGNRMAPVTGYFKFAEIDDLIARSPAEYVRLPKVWTDENRHPSLTTLDLRMLVKVADNSPRPADGAIVRLMGVMGLRVSEAVAVRIEHYQETIRGYRVLHLIGKGNKPATVPIHPQTIESLDRAAGGRTSGTLLLRPAWGRSTAGQPMTRKSIAMTLDRLCREARISSHVTPHDLRRAFITSGLEFGLSIRDMQIAARHSDPRTTTRYDLSASNLDKHANHVLGARFAA